MTRNSHSIKIFYLILAVSVLPLSCDFLFPGREDVNPDIGGVDQELFPLAVGNYWDYRLLRFDRIRTDTIRIEILNEYSLSYKGREYMAFGYSNFFLTPDAIPSEREWLYAHSPRGLLTFGGKYQDEIAVKNTLFLKYPGNAGDTWVSETMVFDWNTEKFTKGRDLLIHLYETDVSCRTELVEMDGCHVYYYEDISTTDAVYHWYRYLYVKPGLGIVSTATFDGPRDHQSPPPREVERTDIINYHINGK